MAIYNGKHCVFEMVGVDRYTDQYNSSSNVDSDGAINNYSISTMRNNTLPRIVLKLSNNLQDNLSDTTIQTATNGINGTLVSTSDKLFLLAQKEMNGTNYARTEENNALTTLSYWINHTSNNDRKKYDFSNNVDAYSLRSPRNGGKQNIVNVNVNGSFDSNAADGFRGVSPCFAF